MFLFPVFLSLAFHTSKHLKKLCFSAFSIHLASARSVCNILISAFMSVLVLSTPSKVLHAEEHSLAKKSTFPSNSESLAVFRVLWDPGLQLRKQSPYRPRFWTAFATHKEPFRIFFVRANATNDDEAPFSFSLFESLTSFHCEPCLVRYVADTPGHFLDLTLL